MSPTDRPTVRAWVTRWSVPAAGVAMGVACLIIGVAHDRALLGVTELVIMLVYATVLVVYRRRGSEPAALLVGDSSDERRVRIHLRSGAATGQVLILAVVAGLFWSLVADNRYVAVFTTLAVLGGVTSVASTGWFSRHG